MDLAWIPTKVWWGLGGLALGLYLGIVIESQIRRKDP